MSFIIHKVNRVRKLIILDHPRPKGNKDDQFAPFREGVNELITKFQK